MIDMLDTPDWREAFGYAGEPDTCGYPSVSAAEGASCSDEPFTREDVLVVHHSREGENDGANWLICGQLKDGRYFYLEAGCDYTGWDCQASGHAVVAEDFDRLIQFGMGDDARTAWGLG